LINHDHSKIEKTIPVSEIIERYQKYIGIDVSSHFKGLSKIELCTSDINGFKYYSPPDIAGDASFYKQLQKEETYYKDEKWEYDKVLEAINTEDKVLEIGCGKGAFLKLLKSHNISGVGLELNDDCVKEGEKNGVLIINELVDVFAKKNKEKYNVVVAFQVLEHISDPINFLKNCLFCLKEHGKLIIAVPNNDSLVFSYQKPLRIRREKQLRTLLKNMPPHHMGLWTREGFDNLSVLLELNIVEYLYEPLNNERYGHVAEILVSKYLDLLPTYLYKLLTKILFKGLSLFSPKTIHSDTIIAVFEKK
jgi:2-polyprenyl-3-methyl-5-hydroxy-6-metoxy-1,4-benzoquinol methylase